MSAGRIDTVLFRGDVFDIARQYYPHAASGPFTSYVIRSMGEVGTPIAADVARELCVRLGGDVALAKFDGDMP